MKFFNKYIDSTGLGVFRILYSIVLLGEVIHLFYFRNLVYDRIPFIEQAEVNFTVLIGIWIVAICFIILGLCTRIASIINYILCVFLLNTLVTYHYHIFFVYTGINFLLIFTPVSKSLSLDNLFEKLKYSNTKYRHKPVEKVRQLHYLIIPFIAIGLVYFDSIGYKLSSETWLTGIGSWMSSSLPMMTHVKDQWLQNQELFIKLVGWGTIAFEFIFIFVFFKKKWRVPVAIMGMLLHLGICFEYPIPFFAIAVVGTYVLLFPVSFWKRFRVKSTSKNPITFYYDKDCPLCIRTTIIISHFDIFNKVSFKPVQLEAINEPLLKDIDESELIKNIYSTYKGNVYIGVDTYINVFTKIFFPLGILLRLPPFYQISKSLYNKIAENRLTERCTDDNCGYEVPSIVDSNKIKILENLTVEDIKKWTYVSFGVFVIFSHIILLINTDLGRKVMWKIGVEKVSEVLPQRYMNFTKIYFGFTNHPVFSDGHFNNYNHIVAVTYVDKNGNEEWLPIINEDGMPSYYCTGNLYVKWNFRVNGPNIDQNLLAKGVQDFTAFWSYRNDVNLEDATFKIKVKKINSSFEWQENLLTNNLNSPWLDGGFIKWENSKFESHIKDIESL